MREPSDPHAIMGDMTTTPTGPARRRGRPPKAEGLDVASTLLEAATEACAEWGYDGATLTRIAERAGVSSTALYNHYPTKEDLLYAAAVRGLERITELAKRLAGGPEPAPALTAAYLQPEMRSTRRLIAEIHLASSRDERLAALLADWHRLWMRAIVAQLPDSDPSPRATVKMMFLLLLGLCHVDDLPAVRAPAAAVVERAETLLRTLGDAPG